MIDKLYAIAPKWSIILSKSTQYIHVHVHVQGRMQDIVKGGSFYCVREARKKFSSNTPTCVGHAPFQSRLPLNRAATRKTTKEPVSFLIVAVVNKAKTPNIM